MYYLNATQSESTSNETEYEQNNEVHTEPMGAYLVQSALQGGPQAPLRLCVL